VFFAEFTGDEGVAASGGEGGEGAVAAAAAEGDFGRGGGAVFDGGDSRINSFEFSAQGGTGGGVGGDDADGAAVVGEPTAAGW